MFKKYHNTFFSRKKRKSILHKNNLKINKKFSKILKTESSESLDSETLYQQNDKLTSHEINQILINDDEISFVNIDNTTGNSSFKNIITHLNFDPVVSLIDLSNRFSNIDASNHVEHSYCGESYFPNSKTSSDYTQSIPEGMDSKYFVSNSIYIDCPSLYDSKSLYSSNNTLPQVSPKLNYFNTNAMANASKISSPNWQTTDSQFLDYPQNIESTQFSSTPTTPLIDSTKLIPAACSSNHVTYSISNSTMSISTSYSLQNTYPTKRHHDSIVDPPKKTTISSDANQFIQLPQCLSPVTLLSSLPSAESACLNVNERECILPPPALFADESMYPLPPSSFKDVLTYPDIDHSYCPANVTTPASHSSVIENQLVVSPNHDSFENSQHHELSTPCNYVMSDRRNTICSQDDNFIMKPLLVDDNTIAMNEVI